MNQFVQDKGVPGLSADERAKHAFYVQRHLDEVQILNLLHNAVLCTSVRQCL